MTALSTPTTTTGSAGTGAGDTVDLTKPARFVVVTNTHASQSLYVVCRAGLLAAHPATTAVANADDVYTIAAGATVVVGSSAKALQWNLSLVGSGSSTTYNVVGSLSQPLAAISNTVSGTITATGTAGVTAADAAVSGNPVTVAGRGSTAVPTAMSADGDTTHFWTSLNGAQVITGGLAADLAVGTTVAPVVIAGRGSTAQPTAMSADGDVTHLWTTLNGGLNVVDRKLIASAAATPAISNGAIYAALDAVGDVMTFTVATASGRAFRIVNAYILDKAKQDALLYLFLFKVTPPSPAADNAAFSFTDANFVTGAPFAVIDFLAANYRDTGANSLGQGTRFGGEVNVQAVTSGSATIFGAMMAGAATTPTYGSTSDLIVTLEVQYL